MEPWECICLNLLRMLVESKPAFSHSWRGITSSALATAPMMSCSLPAMVREWSRKNLLSPISIAPPPVCVCRGERGKQGLGRRKLAWPAIIHLHCIGTCIHPMVTFGFIACTLIYNMKHRGLSGGNMHEQFPHEGKCL